MLDKIIKCVTYLSILLFAQCSPIDIVPSAQGTPVFVLSAETNTGDTIQFSAGIDSFYMFTDFELDADGVYSLIGSFQKEPEVTDSLASLRFEIRDIGANLPAFDIENALMPSSFTFYNQNITQSFDSIYTAAFSATTMGCPNNLPESAFTWDFEDNITATGSSLIMTFLDGRNRNVTLTLDYLNGAQTAVQQNFSFTNTTGPNCSADVSSSFVQNEIVLNVVGTGAAPFSYVWHTSETTSSIIPSQDTIGSDVYSVTVTDSNGCTSIASGSITGTVGNNFCTTGFTYTTEVEVDSSQVSPQYSSVTIVYTDYDGVVYRSDMDAQNANAFFNILSVEDFQNNENGQKTKKLEVEFEIELFSQNQNPIRLESPNSVIAVAYPD